MIDISHVPDPLRLLLSAGPYSREGFVATQQEQLDLLKREDWERSFGSGPGGRKIDVILAEHVWEHLTLDEGRRAAALCFDYLKPGGYIRCGVPDAFFPSDEYQRRVAVGGSGPAADHKLVYDYRLLADVFAGAGFEVSLLEWWDEAGQFHWTDWSADDGLIYRSRRFHYGNQEFDGTDTSKLRFTSIIVDAVKPLSRR